ncbi:hypothetical protein [Cellulomonas fimi]|uniref:Uncharacterized protein n=1 Tax=Cellulomonas fimi TaxID=1708 RepID=A0A7Y0LWD7_CELFI|nr:hypothetical protein [Cellulomonas fimi]NMR19437.1 hypothetical protein [Cellulomonas fimi]
MSTLDDRAAEQPTTTAGVGNVMTFVVGFVLLLGGFWLMDRSFAQGSGLLFAAGIVACGLAYFIPTSILGRTRR